MRALFLIPTLLIFCLYSTAQKNTPGFYINKSGEKITGSFISFRQWNHNPSKVDFATEDRQTVTLTPATCIAFTVNGYDTYVSKEIIRMTNSDNVSKTLLTESWVETYDTINVFLRKIFERDSSSLYEFSDQLRKNYFIQKPNYFSELVFKIDYKEGKVVDDKRYIMQLYDLFSYKIAGDKKKEKQLLQLEYNEKDLVSFFNTIYGFAESTKSKKNKYPAEIVFNGGVSYNIVKVTPYNLGNPRTFLSYGPDISPVLGIGLVHYGQRNFGKYFLTFDFKYTSFKNSSEYYGSNKWVYQSHIVATSIGGGAKWINKARFSWYTAANFSLLLLLNNKETGYVNNNTYAEQKGKTLALGVGLQTGFLYKQWGIWGQYNARISTHSYTGFSPTMGAIYAGISWRMPLKK